VTPPGIAEALRELVFAPVQSVDAVMDKFFAPGYVHRTSGRKQTREEFAEHARLARNEIIRGSATVLDELQTGSAYAERHLLDVTRRDGGRQNSEIYIIGTYAPDGRFASLNETGFPLLHDSEEGTS